MSFVPTSPTERPPSARRTIIIAVDGSDHSKYAFRWSLDNIVRPDGVDWVVLIACMKSDISKDESVKGAKWVEVPLNTQKEVSNSEKAERDRLQNMLLTYQSELNSRLINSKLIVLKGDPKEGLVTKSSDLLADIMIMGSRGLGGLKKAIMGSVSDHCVHNAACPVLIVRKPQG